jgi:hypothetical protein
VHRFFDPATGGPARLEMVSDSSGARFRLLRRIGYHDPHHAEPFVVPDDLEAFRTDLTSVPWFFSWLVPKVGRHLLPAVLHDGMVETRGGKRWYLGPPVDREEADRVFRDAMATSGVRLVRRWLVWTAVTLATAWLDLRPRWWWRLLLVGTLGGIAVMGTVATLDLLDVVAVLPWMGERPLAVELVTGGIAAVVVPLLLSLLWGRLWRAGAIAGVALAWLLHVTAAVVLVFAVYLLAERVFGSSGAREARSPA